MRTAPFINNSRQNVLLSGALHGGEDELHQGAVLQRFRVRFGIRPSGNWVRGVRMEPSLFRCRLDRNSGRSNDGGHPRGRLRAGWYVPHVYVSIATGCWFEVSSVSGSSLPRLVSARVAPWARERCRGGIGVEGATGIQQAKAAAKQ